MYKSRILQRGEEAKFEVAIKDFDMAAHNFAVTLEYGYRRTTVEIPKSAMIHGADGKWYFVFDTDDMIGRVTAVCTWQVPDTDCEDGLRQEEDRQYLCFVATTPCPDLVCVPHCDGNRVTYQRTDQSDIAGKYAYLTTSDGDIIITSDKEAILVLKEINNE